MEYALQFFYKMQWKCSIMEIRAKFLQSLLLAWSLSLKIILRYFRGTKLLPTILYVKTRNGLFLDAALHLNKPLCLSLRPSPPSIHDA